MTERQYVERLSQFLRNDSSNVTVRTVGVGKDPCEVVKKCVEIRASEYKKGKKYDECVCLVDVDNHTTLPIAQRECLNEGITLIVSNLKFEVWLLWHVVDKRSAMNSKTLDNLMTEHKILEKRKRKHLSTKFSFDGLEEAVRIAQAAYPAMESGKVGPNPSSTMPILIRLLQT